MLDGLEYDIQLLFSRFLGWLLLLFHTVIVAGISLLTRMVLTPAIWSNTKPRKANRQMSKAMLAM